MQEMSIDGRTIEHKYVHAVYKKFWFIWKFYKCCRVKILFKNENKLNIFIYIKRCRLHMSEERQNFLGAKLCKSIRL